MPDRRYPTGTPEKRARRKARTLERTLRKTIKALDNAYPDTHRCDEILSRHRLRVAKILNAGRKPAQPFRICPVCGKAILPPPTYWTDSLYFKLLWPPGVCAVFMFSLYQFGMWGLLVPVAAMVISLSFWWSIVVPTLLFGVVVIVLVALGI
jgi:hypothetical protein